MFQSKSACNAWGFARLGEAARKIATDLGERSQDGRAFLSYIVYDMLAELDYNELRYPRIKKYSADSLKSQTVLNVL